MKIIQCEIPSEQLLQLESLFRSQWTDFSFTGYSAALPNPLVIIMQETVIGGLSYTLFKHPNSETEVIWVNAVFVLPEYRGNALASKLIAHSILDARQFGLKTLFTYTNVPGLYAKNGWREVDSETESGHSVMSISL